MSKTIPHNQKFLSRSMNTLLSNRILSEVNAIEQEQNASRNYTSVLEMYSIAKKKQQIANDLLKLQETAKYKNRIRCITTRNNGMISFLPVGQECIINDRGQWSRKNRVECKAGKFLNKMKAERGFTWNDADIEKFVNYYKSKTVIKGEFNLVSGDLIREWYHEDSYAEGCGQLNSSCMQYGNCQDFFGLYTDNPQVKMIILVNEEGKLAGRALLWDEKYMDRVYGSDDTIVAFHNYAEDNGYMNIYRGGECPNIELDDTEFSKYPFMDTLYHVYEDGVSKFSDTFGLGSYMGKAQCTGGGLEGYTQEEDSYYTCDSCGNNVSEEDYLYIDDLYLCQDCVVHSDIEGDYVPKDDATELYNGDWCHSEHARQLNSGDYYHEDDDDIVYCEYDDQNVHYEDISECDYNNENYITNDHVWFNINGDAVVVDVNVNDYLSDNYGFELEDYNLTIDFATDERIEAIIKQKENEDNE